jgi:hypothetical protein
VLPSLVRVVEYPTKRLPHDQLAWVTDLFAVVCVDNIICKVAALIVHFHFFHWLILIIHFSNNYQDKFKTQSLRSINYYDVVYH